MSGPVERGPNYDWKHEARHYQDECDSLRALLRKVENSGDRYAWERDQLKKALEQINGIPDWRNDEASAIAAVALRSIQVTQPKEAPVAAQSGNTPEGNEANIECDIARSSPSSKDYCVHVDCAEQCKLELPTPTAPTQTVVQDPNVVGLRAAIKQALDEIDAELYPDAQDTLWKAYESTAAPAPAVLKEGDRVRVYTVELDGAEGTVGCVNAAGNIRVDYDHIHIAEEWDGEKREYSGQLVHPRQCELLSTTRPALNSSLREWWMAIGPSGKVYEIKEGGGDVGPAMLPPCSNQDLPSWVKVREVASDDRPKDG